MRIAVDGRNLLHELSGLARYLLEVGGALASRGHELTFLMPGEPAADLALPAGASVRSSHMPGLPGRLLWSATVLPAGVRELRPDVFWGPAHRMPPGLPDDLPRLVTIHDLVWRRAPRTMRLKGRLGDRFLMGPAIARADIVCAVSAATAADIAEFFPSARDKVRIVPPPVLSLAAGMSEAGDQTSLGAPSIDSPYVLFVGTQEPRKNLKGLIEAFARLPRELLTSHRLVICGGAGWGGQDAHALAAMNGVADRVTVTGHVDDRALAALYAHARCLAMPSFHEGFGLPIVEAHRFGVPVLTSNRSSMPEVAGEGALYADPDDVASIATQLEKLLRDDALHARLSEMARANAGRYSLTHSADAMEAALQAAVDARGMRR